MAKYPSTLLPEDNDNQKAILDLLAKVNEVHDAIPGQYVPPADSTIYISNSETGINTNGPTSKTFLSVDGSFIVSNTASTYYDMTLPSALVPGESISIQFRSTIGDYWIDAAICGIQSLTAWGFSAKKSYLTGNTGTGIEQFSAGTLRIRFQFCATTSVTDATVSWAAVKSAADGFDKWRVVIK